MAAGATSGPADVRFAFGENWREFSRDITPDRLAKARVALEELLGTASLEGRTLLDIGCGSGLMALAAHEMGALVTAFDYDPESVATSIAVRDAVVGPEAYGVLRGSALDPEFVASLGIFDVVYSWGVLHHTGDLWRGCELASRAVAPGGLLAVAVYNDQGLASRVWRTVKRSYVEGGAVRQRALLITYDAWFRSKDALGDTLALRRGIAAMTERKRARTIDRPRGMDRRHDLIDWVGGYPFQVAKPEEVFHFFRDRGFQLQELVTCRGGLGCNEFVFRRTGTGDR